MMNFAYSQSSLGFDTDLVFSLGLAQWVLPPTQVSPLSNAYFDLSSSTNYIRLAKPYESSVISSISQDRDVLRVKGWLMRGAIREDDGAGAIAFFKNEPRDDPNPDGDLNRFCNHFLDPVVLRHTLDGDTRALTEFCPTGLITKDASQWALGSDSPYDPQPSESPTRRNHFTLLDARESMWRALTLLDKARNPLPLTVNSTTFSQEDLRKAYWATLFRSLGDVVHLLQDVAQPQHTRNEGHGTSNTGYEEYLAARTTSGATPRAAYTIDGRTLAATAGTLSDLTYDGYPAPTFSRYSDYWSTALRTGVTQGLADYSNRGFFTLENNFGNTTYPRPTSNAADYHTEDASSRFGEVNSTYLIGAVTDDVLHVTVPGVSMSTHGVFWPNRYTLSRRDYDDRAALLIPRAVGYSQGLLDYFFRGQMEITPPTDGVYGFVDHSRFSGENAPVTDVNNGFAGFNKIRLNLQNTTHAIMDPTGAT
ncbi:MAG TPA: hypothetical protein VH040_15465, partial [Usitatibacter sp.]|nr:hypothetical protein [Usitatibacter sp.]